MLFRFYKVVIIFFCCSFISVQTNAQTDKDLYAYFTRKFKENLQLQMKTGYIKYYLLLEDTYGKREDVAALKLCDTAMLRASINQNLDSIVNYMIEIQALDSNSLLMLAEIENSMCKCIESRLDTMSDPSSLQSVVYSLSFCLDPDNANQELIVKIRNHVKLYPYFTSYLLPYMLQNCKNLQVIRQSDVDAYIDKFNTFSHDQVAMFCSALHEHFCNVKLIDFLHNYTGKEYNVPSNFQRYLDTLAYKLVVSYDSDDISAYIVHKKKPHVPVALSSINYSVSCKVEVSNLQFTENLSKVQIEAFGNQRYPSRILFNVGECNEVEVPPPMVPLERAK
ncbi:MAG: hypothetical protein RL660_2495 [Bacteroidota bacterium]|jgi:hypothetical protein